MPALYAAISERLGYPLHLVEAKKHYFCRWDGRYRGSRPERLNVEGTNQGLNDPDDSSYMTWPEPISPSEVESGRYLRSLSHVEAIAAFVSLRGGCFEDCGKWKEAAEAFAAAARLAPHHNDYAAIADEARLKLAKEEEKYRQHLQALAREALAQNRQAEARRQGWSVQSGAGIEPAYGLDPEAAAMAGLPQYHPTAVLDPYADSPIEPAPYNGVNPTVLLPRADPLLPAPGGIQSPVSPWAPTQ